METKINSSLVIVNEENVEARPSARHPGMTTKRLIGVGTPHPTERVYSVIAGYTAGAEEKLHWHLCEHAYYILEGNGVLKDIEGNHIDLRPGTLIYCPAGIGGSHAWRSETKMRLMSLGVWNDTVQIPQFDVDDKTGGSSLEPRYLIDAGLLKFKSKP
jgi:mannose-6-phosphate isomerase-like protein (cupin superfamily)